MYFFFSGEGEILKIQQPFSKHTHTEHLWLLLLLLHIYRWIEMKRSYTL